MFKDHLGNEYPTKSAMCEYYGIGYGAFHARLKRGWTLEEALIGRSSIHHSGPGKKCEDHLGNQYETINEMTAFYGVPNDTFTMRLKIGWTLEEALTGRKSDHYSGRGKKCEDHLGNQYETIKEMTVHYGIPYYLFRSRLKSGWTLEEALTKKERKRVSRAGAGLRVGQESVKKQMPIDHLGYRYNSQREMCRHWGVDPTTFCKRIARGWTVEEALTGIRKFVEDHLGNRFANMTEMCEHYGIRQSLYRDRLQRGWSMEECLTGKGKPRDHLGNVFRSRWEMCEYYGVDLNTYRGRLRYGWTMEEALTGKEKKVTDHLGNRFKTVKEMCIHWGVPTSTYVVRKSKAWTLEECLTGKMGEQKKK